MKKSKVIFSLSLAFATSAILSFCGLKLAPSLAYNSIDAKYTIGEESITEEKKDDQIAIDLDYSKQEKKTKETAEESKFESFEKIEQPAKAEVATPSESYEESQPVYTHSNSYTAAAQTSYSTGLNFNAPIVDDCSYSRPGDNSISRCGVFYYAHNYSIFRNLPYATVGSTISINGATYRVSTVKIENVSTINANNRARYYLYKGVSNYYEYAAGQAAPSYHRVVLQTCYGAGDSQRLYVFAD